MTGKTISHYRVLEKLGAGGMGVVYRAMDVRLERPVALKFLPEHLTRDRAATDRFEREARAASSLNHESICTIYEIEEADGLVFLVMELLEGESLHDRLARGRLSFQEVLEYAEQLVEALVAAHAKGICHRDIKPANIFLVAGRRAKLLDFGLAKIEPPSDASQYTTVVHPSATLPGTVAGTVAYMSPEQALGQPVDPRSDLFSLGLVLHEMATGKRAFTGATGALYDAILNKNPPAPSTIISTIPAGFNRIVEKALEKDKTVRYQSAADMGADIKRLRRGEAVAPPAKRRPVRTMAIAGIAVALVAAVIGYVVFVRSRDARPFLEGAKFTQITDMPGVEVSPSLSPDGRSVAYASRMRGNWDIYLQRVDDKTPVNITLDSPVDDIDPAFSPDGGRIAFRSDRNGGGIFEMGALGGSVRRIVDFGHSPAWSPDQKYLVFATERVETPTTRLGNSVLWKVEVATQNRQQLTTMDAVQPSWSPNGDRIAFWSVEGAQRSIWTIPANGGTAVRVTNDAFINSNPVWAADGRYLFFASDRGGAMNLWRVAIDERSGAVQGLPEPVTTGSANGTGVTFARNAPVTAFVQQTFARNIARMSLDRPNDAPTPITRGTRVLRQLDLSPDGRMLAYSFGQTGQSIYVMDADGGNVRRLTEEAVGVNNRAPRWSPDGTRIAFYSNRTGSYQVWTIKPDGSDPRQVTDYTTKPGVYYPVWSNDGRAMNVTGFDSTSWTFDLQKPWNEQTPSSLPQPSAGTTFVAWSWSADGSALAGWQIESNSGQSRGIVVYDPRSKQYRQITKIGIYPVWLNDGTHLLFASSEKLFTVNMASGKITDVPTPRAFANDFSLSRDNRWLYYNEDQREGDVWLITRGGASQP